MAQAQTITTFLIDVNPTMAEVCEIQEEVQDPDDPTKYNKVKRKVTKLEWCLEFVIKKIQQSILSGLSTNQVCVFLFNSSKGRNKLLDERLEGSYDGIYELWNPAHPNLILLEQLKNLRATKLRQVVSSPGDAIDATVVAITSILDKDHSKTAARPSWNRVIYIVTDARTEINTADLDDIRAKIKEEHFYVRVMGVDFDSEFDEEEEEPVEKPEIVQTNEEFWHNFLKDLPGSGITSASDAVRSTQLPSLLQKKSVAQNCFLVLGDAELSRLGRDQDTALRIAVSVYKHTALARPVSRQEIAKVMPGAAASAIGAARGAGGGDRGEGTSAMGAAAAASISSFHSGFGSKVTRMQAFYDFQEAKKTGMDNLDRIRPLPEDVEKEKGYKLGADVIPLPEAEHEKASNAQSLEIINFQRQSEFQREWEVGEVSYVFADTKSSRSHEAQLMISAIAQGLFQKKRWALARYVSKFESDPRIVALWPKCEQDWDCLVMVNVCYSDDVRKYTFPPLFRAKMAEGGWTTEHASIPNEQQQAAMDRYLDTLDLGVEEELNEDGEPTGKIRGSWFNVDNSFSLGLHRVNQVVSARATYPDRALPKISDVLVKYTNRKEPENDMAAGDRKDTEHEAKILFNVISAEPKTKKKKRGRGDEAVEEGNQEGGADENEDERDIKKSSVQIQNDRGVMDTDGEQHEQPGDPQRKEENAVEYPPPGDVLDLDNDPVDDFQAREEEDDPRALLFMTQRSIVQLYRQNFSARNFSTIERLLILCRQFAMENDEAILWNKFMRAFKEEILHGDRPRPEFWNSHLADKWNLGLISTSDDIHQRIQFTDGKAAKAFMALQ